MDVKQVGPFRPDEVSERLNRRWKEIGLVKKIRQLNEGGKKFYYIDGPPYANAPPHIGHALTRTMRETILKYKQMGGFNVWAQPGFDTHGLPVEVVVQDKLRLKTNEDIEKYGVEKFNEECRKHALSSFGDWTKFYETYGSMATWGLDDPYLTYKNDYISSSWLFFKKAKEKGMIYRGKKSVPWCPKCGTSLSAHEASQEYKDIEDIGIYMKFPAVGQENAYFFVWTTTPWTLPGNVAIAVNPKYNYSWVDLKWKGKDETWVMAEDLVPKLMAKMKIDAYLVSTIKSGKEMEGMGYRHIMAGLCPCHDNKDYPVVVADYVTKEDGTGLVHTAPGYGPEDYDTGMKYGLEILCTVDEEGVMDELAGKYSGLYVFDANKPITDDLMGKDRIVKAEPISHRYAHCWRCRNKLIYRASPQWFIRIDPIKKKMVEENRKVKWVPSWAGEKRFNEWLENARDWCISHQKYWGIPLPFWQCECGNLEVIGSEDELRAKAENYREGMDLHKPFIDGITVKCGKCGKGIKRVPDVTDVWFDSGAATWASMNYPKESRLDKWFPMDFITEGVDQTRGWFYTLLVESVTVFDKTPFNSVLVNGLILDSNGEKMSKSKGNAVHPMKVINDYGADVIRWFLIWSTNPWEDTRFDPEEIRTIKSAANTLWNSYTYAAKFSSMNGYDGRAPERLEPEDRWILSKLEGLKKRVSESYDGLDLNGPARAMRDFIVDDLSRDYIKFIRDRIKNKENDSAAYYALKTVLSGVSKLLAPTCPFIADEIYMGIDGSRESVHLEQWPKADAKLIDAGLEEEMDLARAIIESALSARNLCGINTRQALGDLVVVADRAPSVFTDIIARQANVLNVSYVGEEPVGEYVSAEGNGFKAFLGTRIDDRLRRMGITRETVRCVQQLRKENALVESDAISVSISCPDAIREFIDLEEAKRITNSKEISFGENKGKKAKVSGEEVSIEIMKLG